jgi:two-component system chemotaxis response regulator CheY
LDGAARVVVASADIQTSTRAIAEEAGALGFINKPFAAESVLGAVESAMGGE